MPRGRPSRSTKRLSDAEREKIAAAIRAGGTRNEVARAFNRSAGTITRIATDFGLSFDRSKTKEATEALRADTESRLERAKQRLLDEFEAAMDELHKPAMSMKWDDGVLIQQEIDEPTFTDKRHIAFRANGFIQYALAIHHRSDAPDDASEAAVKTWMQSVREEAGRREE